MAEASPKANPLGLTAKLTGQPTRTTDEQEPAPTTSRQKAASTKTQATSTTDSHQQPKQERRPDRQTRYAVRLRRDSSQGEGNGLAFGAAAGTLHPSADRPLSRPGG